MERGVGGDQLSIKGRFQAIHSFLHLMNIY